MKKKKIKKVVLGKLKIAKIDSSEKVFGGSRIFACFSVGDPIECVTVLEPRCIG
ncbi:hypothetical protein [uncultured Kordia sp.]|uniref:hypothetical protein n=1 Tax=uncultured Kordia sp. TaxID=507699 RepID=UPI0026230E8A|nr:hypothetical protein [uncultured Kordia sp.]